MSAVDPKSLPVRDYANRILAAVRSHPVTIVIGETGSGKTTQISQVQLITTELSRLYCDSHSSARPHPNWMGHVTPALWVQILEEAGFAKHGRIAVTQPRRVVCNKTFTC